MHIGQIKMANTNISNIKKLFHVTVKLEVENLFEHMITLLILY